jgi:hypothetical protein
MWTILIVSAVLATVIIIALARNTRAARKRSDKWEDLHERGKMFAAQLAHLRERSAAKQAPPPPPPPPPGNEVPAPQPSRKSRSLWPRRPMSYRTDTTPFAPNSSTPL